MARIPYPDPKKLSPQQNELLKKANLNVFTMWAHSQNTIELIIGLGAAQFAKLELPRGIREMVTLLGAHSNTAFYEWGQHIELSKAAGVSDEQRAALACGDVDAACFSAAEQAALRLAAAVLAGPKVSDETFGAAEKYLNNRQLVEMVGVIGYYWMLGRIATVFQVDFDIAKGTDLYDAGLKLAAQTSA